MWCLKQGQPVYRSGQMIKKRADTQINRQLDKQISRKQNEQKKTQLHPWLADSASEGVKDKQVYRGAVLPQKVFTHIS